ncbi:Leucine-rich repeat-containing protein 31, partial [Mortierella sp. AD032]
MTMREDNAQPVMDSVSATSSGSSTITTDMSGFAPQIPPPNAASSSSSSSTSASSSTTTTQLTQHEQLQVEQYKDDIMLHTQLQLQLYLEDMEEAETVAEFQAHIDQAAFAESLVNSAHALDPLQDSLLPTSPFGSGGPLSPDMTQIFQQQMMTLESNALAAAAAADATAPQDFLHAGAGGLGGLGVGGGGQSEHAHYRHEDRDLDWAEDDDDEDCSPPSETKYVLYDDRVQPVSMAQALVLLNDPLLDDLVVHVHSNNSGHYTHDHDTDDNLLQSHLQFSRDGAPIYSAVSPPSASLSSFPSSLTLSDTRRDAKINAAGAISWRINHTGHAYEGQIDDNFDDNYHSWEHEEITRKGHSHTMGLPSPPTASAASKSLQAGFFGSDSDHHSQANRCYGDETSDDNGCDEEGDCEEENDQGRLSHRRGPDIYINLAGTFLSPINIHDIFFSQFYSRLVYLSLCHTNLGTWGAQAVGGLMADRVCRIQYLNLAGNRLDFEGIVQLAGLYKNQSLIELDLSDNQLGPKAIHSLQQISDWGASTILAAFESNELTLKEINMKENPLTFAGGVDLCKILVLPQSRITHLDLCGAKVTDVGVPYLAEALKSHDCPIVSLN